MQSEWYMFLITMIIIAFYIYNKRVALSMAAFAAILFSAVAINQAWVNQQSYTGFYKHEWPQSRAGSDQGLYYFRFWNRAGVYFVGLMVGFIFRELDVINHKISPYVSTVLQLFACLMLFTIAAVLYTDITGPPMGHAWLDLIGKAGWTNVGEAVYIGLARPCWGIGLSILAYSFIYNDGQKGFLNRMLSLPVYSPLSKLSFVGYLIHLD